MTITALQPDIRQPDVTELVEAARGGDAAAFEELVRRFEPFVRNVARRYRLSDADVHDVAQTTWLRLWENLGRLRRPEGIASWLATTAARESLRLIRDQQRTVFADDWLAERPDDRGPAPEQSAIDTWVADVLQEQIAALPGRGQVIVRALSRPDPPAYAELSREIGMPVGSIGPTRGRYLRRLRTRLEDAGLGLAG